jgi:hypothetical protein
LDLAHFARQASREFWHFFLDSPNFRHILGLLSRNMVIEVEILLGYVFAQIFEFPGRILVFLS